MLRLILNNLCLPEQKALDIKNLDLYYGDKQALQDILQCRFQKVR